MLFSPARRQAALRALRALRATPPKPSTQPPPTLSTPSDPEPIDACDGACDSAHGGAHDEAPVTAARRPRWVAPWG